MPFPRDVPEIAIVNGKRTMPDFVPGTAAINWPRYKGQTGTLYVVESSGFYKIGIATDFAKRFRGIDLGTPLPVNKVAIRTVPLAGLAYAEAWLHQQHKDKRVKGEWFTITREEACALLKKAVAGAQLYEVLSAEVWWKNRPYHGTIDDRFPVPTIREIERRAE